MNIFLKNNGVSFHFACCLIIIRKNDIPNSFKTEIIFDTVLKYCLYLATCVEGQIVLSKNRICKVIILGESLDLTILKLDDR